MNNFEIIESLRAELEATRNKIEAEIDLPNWKFTICFSERNLKPREEKEIYTFVHVHPSHSKNYWINFTVTEGKVITLFNHCVDKEDEEIVKKAIHDWLLVERT